MLVRLPRVMTGTAERFGANEPSRVARMSILAAGKVPSQAKTKHSSRSLIGAMASIA